jgi:hypothetical protein
MRITRPSIYLDGMIWNNRRIWKEGFSIGYIGKVCKGFIRMVLMMMGNKVLRALDLLAF